MKDGDDALNADAAQLEGAQGEEHLEPPQKHLAGQFP